MPEPLAHRELQLDTLVCRLERGERGDRLVLLLDSLRDALLAHTNRIVNLAVHLEQLVLGYLDLLGYQCKQFCAGSAKRRTLELNY